MTVRIAVSMMALAALASAPGFAMASTSPQNQVLAQATTPLVIPPAPASSDPSSAGQSSPATPAPSGTDTTGTGTIQTPAAPPAISTTPDAATPAEASPAPDQPSPGIGEDNAGESDSTDPNAGDELSLGEIPTIETIQLTPDIAKRALDSYLIAKDKYADTDLDQYEDLQDFVDKTEDGKKFEGDVKAAGFANVTDWNLAISTLTLTYGSVVDDQTADLEQQIKEVEEDADLAQDMKDKMVKALKALIPSDNNKKVIEELMTDPVYGPKLKQLDTEEE